MPAALAGDERLTVLSAMFDGVPAIDVRGHAMVPAQ